MAIAGALLALFSVILWSGAGVFSLSRVDYYYKPYDCTSRTILGTKKYLRDFLKENATQAYPMFTEDGQEIGVLNISENDTAYYFYFIGNNKFEDIYKGFLSHLDLTYSADNLNTKEDIAHLTKYNDMSTPEICRIKTKTELRSSIDYKNGIFYLGTFVPSTTKSEEKTIIFASTQTKSL